MDTIVPINAGIVLTTRLTLMRPLMQIKNGGTTQLAPITATDDEIREALTSAHLAPHEGTVNVHRQMEARRRPLQRFAHATVRRDKPNLTLGH